MATVTGFTAERMQEIEDTTVVDGTVDLTGRLKLRQRDGTEIIAGHVVGPEGPEGPAGPTSIEICTSSTRPGSPTQGLAIYETDTKMFLIWNNVRWDRPWHEAWGLLDVVDLSGGANNSGGVLTGTLTVDLLKHRSYKITAQFGIYTATDAGKGLVKIRADGVSIGQMKPVSLGAAESAAMDVQQGSFSVIISTTSTDTVTFDVHYTALTATTRNIDPTILESYLSVEDIGAAGLPAA